MPTKAESRDSINYKQTEYGELEQLFRQLARMKLESDRGDLRNKCVRMDELHEAYTYQDEIEPGKHVVSGYGPKGRVEGTVTYVDLQSESPGAARLDERIEVDQFAEKQRKPADIAADASAAIEERIDALGQWIALDNDSAATFILKSLECEGEPDEWRSALIFAAEDVRFPTEEQQTRAATRLRELAIEFRQRPDSGSELVVWSALRRFASLIPEEHIGELLPFLSPAGAVDTRLVALQCMVHIHEPAPPQLDSDIHRELADRAFDYATKCLDPDVLIPGETSAIAEQAVMALAAMGDARLTQCIAQLQTIDVAWLSRIVRKALAELREGWSEHESHPACHLIDAVLGDWNGQA